MDDNNDDSNDLTIREIYETFNSTITVKDAEEYLKILEQHSMLSVSFKDQGFLIIFSSESWRKIIQMMDEEKKYSLAYIFFSITNEVDENDIWVISKNVQSLDKVELQDFFSLIIYQMPQPPTMFLS